MSDKSRERLAEHLLYETNEGADVTQLENMTGLSRKIISYLDEFKRPYQDSPDASSLMKHLKEKSGITDESIIINSIKNILQYRNNDVVVGKAGKEKKNLVSMEIYNYCSTLLKGYESMLETIEDNQNNISDIFETDPNQMKIEFPKDGEK